MRALILLALLLGPSAAFAQAVPPLPTAPGSSPQSASAQKKADAEAVADCERMWDKGTHMTKQDWSRTCRRVQGRLQNLLK